MTLDTTQALNSVFQIAAFLTAMLFSVYCFCIVSNNSFIAKVKHTKSFASGKEYIKGTFSLGMVITLLSLLATSIADSDGLKDGFFYFLLIISTYWLLRFIRCYRLFEVLSAKT